MSRRITDDHKSGKLRLMDDGIKSPSLTYWLREGRSSNAEIDFILQLGQAIVPVEGKTGKSGLFIDKILFNDYNTYCLPIRTIFCRKLRGMRSLWRFNIDRKAIWGLCCEGKDVCLLKHIDDAIRVVRTVKEE